MNYRNIMALLFCTASLTLFADTPIFTEQAEALGLDFVHFNGMSGELYFPEMTGQGGCVLDYDNDGDLDIFLIQGCVLGPGKTMKDMLFPSKDPNPRDRLFRNDLSIDKKGNRSVSFTDVTDQAGLNSTGYGMGATAADFNNDGWVDLYVTNYGGNVMFFNNGDGTFTDVTEKTGTGDDLWGTSAAAFDYDHDGWLDLYVNNYVVFDIVANKKCYSSRSSRDYCGPAAFPPQRDRFYHNKGDGTFEEVAEKVLIDFEAGSGLGVILTDVNMDGWLDIYVANDGQPNHLWLSNKGKTFDNDALFSGTSVNQDGQAEASMGLDAGDFDLDGDEDIFLSHLMGETNTLYVNDGTGLFEDQTISHGLSAESFPFTAFGNHWVDYDNDSWLDLFVVNGAVLIVEELERKKDPYPLHMPNLLYRNEKGKKFINVTSQAGDGFKLSEVSRGAAFGDLDNDGDIDVVVFNNNGRARLFMNNVGQDNHWLGLKLIDPKSKRDLLGTLVIVKRKGLPDLVKRVRTDGSYCASNDPRVLFGLGSSDKIDSVEITWIDGTKEVWKTPVVDSYTTLKKGAVGK